MAQDETEILRTSTRLKKKNKKRRNVHLDEVELSLHNKKKDNNNNLLVFYDLPTNIGIARGTHTHTLAVATLEVVSHGEEVDIWVALRFSYH